MRAAGVTVLHSTDAARAVRGAASKTGPREGRQEAESAMEGTEQTTGPAVPERAKQGPDARDPRWDWAEASIWTERMTSALENGVKGGKWFSLIDKAIRPTTLDIAWRKVAANKGAAGVDGESVERFAARSDVYLRELGECLSARTYRPSPVKRVEIPKGDGKTRPLGIPTVRTASCRRR